MEKTRVQIPTEFRELFTPTWRYYAIYGGRGSLKSHTVARFLLLKGRESKKRILATREIQKTIKDSVHKLLSDIINLYGFDDYEVKNDTIRNRITGSEFIFTGLHNNYNEIKSMEGIDYCWCEEAQSITKESIEVLTPTIRKPGSVIIFTYNRLNELDPVHVKFVLNKPPKTCVINVNYDVALNLGWMPDVLKDEMEFDRLNNPSLYAHKWLGEPISQADNAILSRDDVLNAMQRTTDGEGRIIVGVDVARMGDDRTVLWKRKGLKTIDYKVYTKLRTTEVCDKIDQFVIDDEYPEIKIDDTGVGGGVTDEMMKRAEENNKYEIIPINFGSIAGDQDKYPNLISEAWFGIVSNLKEMELPMDQDLLMELTTRTWKQDSKGKRRVESKNEYKKRGFRSPDLADACIICYYTPDIITVDDISM